MPLINKQSTKPKNAKTPKKAKAKAETSGLLAQQVRDTAELLSDTSDKLNSFKEKNAKLSDINEMLMEEREAVRKDAIIIAEHLKHVAFIPTTTEAQDLRLAERFVEMRAASARLASLPTL